MVATNVVGELEFKIWVGDGGGKRRAHRMGRKKIGYVEVE